MKIIIKYKPNWFQYYFNIKRNEYTYTSFDIIPKYDNIVYIECIYCHLSKLPELPNSLLKLSCGNNQLTSLPELPKSLKELYCRYNKLTELPELPNTLQYLSCSKNQFIKKQKYIYLIKIIYM
jgi:Leucine-rich repeat (LRR) protein